jgi:hypothetical protein
MNDPEELLRRYRPLGPPPALRDRIAAAARSSEVARSPAHAAAARAPRPASGFRSWLPAAAAALIAVTFSALASSARQDVAEQLRKGALTRAAVVSELAASLGGGPAAREEAERLVQLDELKSRAEPRGVGAGEGEVNNRD